MPTGTIVSIEANTAGGSGDGTLVAQFMMTGVSSRGPIDQAVIATSYRSLVDQIGRRYAAGTVHDQARAFFGENEGVGRFVFARVVGSGTVSVGSVSVNDRASTPVATVRFDAANPGPWSSNVAVVVSDGVLPGTVNVTVTNRGEPVETYLGLASPAAITTAVVSSLFVRAVNLGSPTPAYNPAAPSPNTNMPAPGTYTLSAGADDVANVTAARLIAALELLTPDLGPGIVAIPGQPAASVAAGLTAHCAGRTGRTCVVTAPLGTAYTSAVPLARALRSLPQARTARFVYGGGVMLPPDVDAGARLITEEGAYAGRRAAVIGRIGVHQPPAGENGIFRYVTAAGVKLTAGQIDALVDDAIVPIASTPSLRIYGDRSLSADPVTWRFGSYTEVMNALAWDVSVVLDRFIGRAIDGLHGEFFGEVLTAVHGAAQPYADSGALVPDGDHPPFEIDLSANTGATISVGQVIVDIAARPSPVSELIRERVTKTGFAPAAA